MTKWLIVLLLCSPQAAAQAVRDRNGDLIMRLSHVDGRTEARDPRGDLLGTWKKEGDFIVHRAPNGDLLTRTGP